MYLVGLHTSNWNRTWMSFDDVSQESEDAHITKTNRKKTSAGPRVLRLL